MKIREAIENIKTTRPSQYTDHGKFCSIWI